MPPTLVLRLRLTTPAFLGGADQSPALRPASLKGLLRFWYRAMDPRFAWRERKDGPTREERLFGGASKGAGQSPFLLHADPVPLKQLAWSAMDLKRFDQGHGRHRRNGLAYLGYPFGMRGGGREALAAGQPLVFRCILVRNADDPEQRRALLGAWWLLAHLGGVGSRSRRGFGSLNLEEWGIDGNTQGWPELEALPLPLGEKDVAAGRAGLAAGLATVREWYGPFAEGAEHPHLGKSLAWRLRDEAFAPGDWQAAMNALGRTLQDFRQRRPPDYDAVRGHLNARAHKGGQFLTSAPQRASFGLPLTFRYSTVRGTVTFVPHDPAAKTTRERQGSLLSLRIAAVGGHLHPLFVRLAGAVPGVDTPVAERGRGLPLAPATGNAMDQLMASLEG
jgi:CRISPR-associated protein Cmr1